MVISIFVSPSLSYLHVSAAPVTMKRKSIFKNQQRNRIMRGSLFFLAAPQGSGILVPRRGIETTPPAVEARSLNHWTTREVLRATLFLICFKFFFFYNEQLLFSYSKKPIKMFS